MKKIILAGLLAFGLTTAAIANEDGGGTYFGFTSGNTGFNDDSIGVLEDNSDSGRRIYGGYQFNKIVGIEATYADYGKFYYSTTELSVTAMSVAANLGYNFLDAQLRPFALVGLSYLNLDQVGTSIYSDENTISFAYGIGVEFAPKALKGLAFRLSWNADIFVVTEFGNDEDYVQAFDLLSVGVQYKF